MSEENKEDSSIHGIKSKGIRIMHKEYIAEFKITTPKPLTEEQKKQLMDLIESWNV